MKRTLFYICFYLIPAWVFSQTDINRYIDQITIKSIKTHMDTLASESMEGRMSGERGQKLAAEYIANEFAKLGLLPFDTNDTNPYYQKFNLYRYQTGTASFYFENQMYPAPVFIGSNVFKGKMSDEIVFTGYADQDALLKLKLRDESIFLFSKNVKDAINEIKIISENYQMKTFVVGLPFENSSDVSDFNFELKNLISFSELYEYYNYFVQDARNGEDFRILRDNNLVLPEIKIKSSKDIKILFVPEELASGLFNKDLSELKSIAVSSQQLKYESLFSVKKSFFSYEADYNPKIDTIKTENVIGYIDSEWSDETIIISAHYDHVGINADKSINYGADDNASGTTAILSIAQVLSILKDSIRLQKDVVFIAFSAEELGLHGSEFYVKSPLIPLKNTNLIINLDMIGRNMDDDPKNANRVFLLEWENGKQYIKKVKKLNKKYTHLLVDTSPGMLNKTLWTSGSDHYSFAQKNISSVAYFTALHKDYHSPGDTADKINFEKMQRIIQLVLLNIIDISTE